MSESRKNEPMSKKRPQILSIWKTKDGINIVGGMDEGRLQAEDSVSNALFDWKMNPKNDNSANKLNMMINCVKDLGFGLELIVDSQVLEKSVRSVDVVANSGYIDESIHLVVPPITVQRKLDRNYGATIEVKELRDDEPTMLYKTQKDGVIGSFDPADVTLIKVFGS